MQIGKKVFSSLRWMAAGRFSGQLVTWVVTILVMRILAPEDYGLVAMAMVVIGFLTLFEELGLGAALVQQRELPKNLAGSILGLLIVFDLILYALLFATAPFIATFFAEPALVDLVRVVAVQLPLQALAVVPDAMLSRRMEFQRKSVVQFCAMISGSLLTLFLAFRGFGVWALIFGNLGGAVVRVLGMNIAARFWVLPSLRVAGFGKAIRFGGFITVDRFLWYVYSQADVFIIGKVLGKEVLGFYSVAMHLASLPMRKIAGMLNEVGFSAFARIQDDREQVSANMCKAARLLAFIAFPIFFGISSVAPEIVGVFLVDRWAPAILPIQLLSLMVPLRLLGTVMPSSLYGLGKARVSVVNTMIACLLMPAAFLFGVQYGLAGVCIAWVIVFPIYFLIAMSRTLPVLGVALADYLKGLVGPLVSAAAMYVTVAAVRHAIESLLLLPIMEMAVLVGVGVLTYLLVVFWFFPVAAREFLSLVLQVDNDGKTEARFVSLLKMLVPRPVKAAIMNWYRRRKLDQTVAEIKRLPAGVAIPDRLLEQMHFAWGNEGWSADLDYLSEVCRRAQESDGPVLECGSGLTTILMGLVLRGSERKVWVLEHHVDWHRHVGSMLARYELDNIEMCHAPLRAFGEFTWYDAPLPRMPDKFSVVVCDGPPESTPGGRYGLLPVMRQRLAADCLILVDDTQRDSERSMLARWNDETHKSLAMDWTAQGYVVCRLT